MSADARYVHPLQSTSNVYFSRAWNAASSVEEPERRSALLTALSQLATEQRWFVPLLGSGAPLEFNEFASRHNQRLSLAVEERQLRIEERLHERDHARFVEGKGKDKGKDKGKGKDGQLLESGPASSRSRSPRPSWTCPPPPAPQTPQYVEGCKLSFFVFTLFICDY